MDLVDPVDQVGLAVLDALDDDHNGSLYSLRGFYPYKEYEFNSYGSSHIYEALYVAVYQYPGHQVREGVITVHPPYEIRLIIWSVMFATICGEADPDPSTPSSVTNGT